MTQRSIRAAVLSAGAWSRSAHLPTLVADPGVDLVAITSPRQETVDDLAAEFGVAHSFTDFRQALELQPDVVVVSSPPAFHVEQVCAALDAGAHVLVEKPFALNAADARTMHECAGRNDRQLLVGFGWSATPVFRFARQQVADGHVGQLEQLTMHLAVNTRALLGGSSDGGWGGATQSRPGTYTDPAISGGGSTAVSMSHQLGLVCWITGQQVERLTAATYPIAAQQDLHSAVLLEFAGSGAGVISSASTQPYLPTPQWHLALYGSGGQLWVDTIKGEGRWVAANGAVTELSPELADGSYDAGAPTRALIDCARGSLAPDGMSSELAVQVQTITDAIYRSARERTTVSICD